MQNQRENAIKNLIFRNNVDDVVSIPIEQDSSSSNGDIKELKDGLTLERIKKDFPWILEAKIKDAVLGLKDNKSLIWYQGEWIDGSWMVLGWMVSGKMVSG